MDLISFLPRAVMQGIPLLYGSTGEILTEKSGNLNLGIPGIMYVGGICGVIGAFFYEQSNPCGLYETAFLGRLESLCCAPCWASLLNGSAVLPADGEPLRGQPERDRPCHDHLSGVGIGNFFGGSLIKADGQRGTPPSPFPPPAPISANPSPSPPNAAGLVRYSCPMDSWRIWLFCWRCWPPTSSSTPVPDCISGPWVRAHPRRTPPASTSPSTSIWLPASAV